jgi:hypothetical protein
MVGGTGVEPVASAMSTQRSNRAELTAQSADIKQGKFEPTFSRMPIFRSSGLPCQISGLATVYHYTGDFGCK